MKELTNYLSDKLLQLKTYIIKQTFFNISMISIDVIKINKVKTKCTHFNGKIVAFKNKLMILKKVNDNSIDKLFFLIT